LTFVRANGEELARQRAAEVLDATAGFRVDGLLAAAIPTRRLVTVRYAWERPRIGLAQKP